MSYFIRRGTSYFRACEIAYINISPFPLWTSQNAVMVTIYMGNTANAYEKWQFDDKDDAEIWVENLIEEINEKKRD